jgi:hypothetical protein
MTTLRSVLAWVLPGVAIAAFAPSARAQTPLSEEEAFKIGTEAYVYGYPLVTVEMTRQVITNTAKPEGTHAPMGQFANLRSYPTAAFKDVTAPNADTLYSSAFLDVSKEPYILSIPDAKGRYYLMPMLDGWTTVFQVPGKRTTGTEAQKYAITGPNWKGKLPKGVKEYKSPTGLVWIIGRTYCTGTKKDYQEVHAFQDKLSLVPLSAYGKKKYTPPAGKVDPGIDMKTPVRDQVNAMDAATYFKTLAQLMKTNPPAKADAPMVAKMAKIGLVPGKDFDMSKLPPDAAKGLEKVPKAAQDQIMDLLKKARKVNGWMFTTKTGIYGTDYLDRATITMFGLGANRPKDAVYPTSETGKDGEPYSGANKYVLHIPKGQMPPAKAFWSLTMYDDKYFFVDNPLNRYTLSSRNKFKTNKDGSVDLYLQNKSPGKDKEANWLPAPEGRFILMLRLYWPRVKAPSILDGTWQPPAVTRVP